MRKDWRRICHAKALFFAVLLPIFIISLLYTAIYKQKMATIFHNIQKLPQEVDYRREIAAQLVDIVREIKNLDCKVNPNIPLRLNAIIGQLDSRFVISDEEILGTHETETDVCRDTFNSTHTGYPFYQQNDPPPTNCSGAKRPINELITILVNSPQPPDRIAVLLTDIRTYQQHIPVIIANVDAKLDASLLRSKFGNVQFVSVDKKLTITSPGAIWNLMAHQVTTPYVLLGRDLEYFNAFARLERQIYVISVSDVVAVAGGAFRNTTGHWRVGCYQSEMKNYYLGYIEGYRYSAYSCMFCDHLEGPFVARTSVLRDLPFNENLPDVVVFQDWFLALKQSGQLVVSCPDAMYFVHGDRYTHLYGQRQKQTSSWLALAKKWQLNRISVPPNVVYDFSCMKVGLSCDTLIWRHHYLLPSCCLKQMTKAWRALQEFASQHNIRYELDSGTMLGAVKMQSHMPWDPDADVFFDTSNYTTFHNNQAFFLSKGLYINSFDTKNDGYFRIWTPEIKVEMLGRKILTTTFLPARLQQVPTLVSVLGVWLQGVANPGLYARSRFGFDYLRHAPHYSCLGTWDSFFNYSKHLKWLPCPKRHHHACLDHYPTDGSIAFLPDIN